MFGTVFVRLRASEASADFTNSLLSDTSSLYYKLWPTHCCQSWLALYLNSYRFTLLPLLYLRLSCFFFFFLLLTTSYFHMMIDIYCLWLSKNPSVCALAETDFSSKIWTFKRCHSVTWCSTQTEITWLLWLYLLRSKNTRSWITHNETWLFIFFIKLSLAGWPMDKVSSPGVSHSHMTIKPLVCLWDKHLWK